MTTTRFKYAGKSKRDMTEVRITLGFAILVAFALICFWRGVWGLLDEYFLPKNRKMSFWISAIVGLVILIITNYAVQTLV